MINDVFCTNCKKQYDGQHLLDQLHLRPWKPQVVQCLECKATIELTYQVVIEQTLKYTTAKPAEEK